MRNKKITGITLVVGAVIVLALGAVLWMNGHSKSGAGLAGLSVVLVGIGVFSFFTRASTEKVQVDREWM